MIYAYSSDTLSLLVQTLPKMKMKFDQDLCLNLQYDFGKMNSTLGSVVPLAMFNLVDFPLRGYREGGSP